MTATSDGGAAPAGRERAAAPVLLTTTGLTKRFGHFAANCDVSLEVRRGELHAVIGPNGAGKTTFFNVLAGTLLPSAGEIRFDGREITRLPTTARVRLGIAKAFQTANLFPRESVLQNCRLAALAHLQGTFALELFARSARLAEVDRLAIAAIDDVDLGAVAFAPAGELSHGDKKRLDIAVALATQPQLLLLDEPVAGMSIEESQKTERLIRRLARRMTVLIIEHDMDMIMGISDRISVLHQGRLLASGTPEAIRNDRRVQEAYLGGHVGEALAMEGGAR